MSITLSGLNHIYKKSSAIRVAQTLPNQKKKSLSVLLMQTVQLQLSSFLFRHRSVAYIVVLLCLRSSPFLVGCALDVQVQQIWGGVKLFRLSLTHKRSYKIWSASRTLADKTARRVLFCRIKKKKEKKKSFAGWKVTGGGGLGGGVSGAHGWKVGISGPLAE